MKTYLIPIFLFVCAISSCDPVTNYSRIIKNDSSHEIYVIKKNFPVCDTVTIGLGEEYTVYKQSSRSSTDRYRNCDDYPVSDTFLLRVKDDTSLTINASVTGNANWNFVLKQKTKMNRGGICSCRLTITDDLIN